MNAPNIEFDYGSIRKRNNPCEVGKYYFCSENGFSVGCVVKITGEKGERGLYTGTVVATYNRSNYRIGYVSKSWNAHLFLDIDTVTPIEIPKGYELLDHNRKIKNTDMYYSKGRCEFILCKKSVGKTASDCFKSQTLLITPVAIVSPIFSENLEAISLPTDENKNKFNTIGFTDDNDATGDFTYYFR